MSHYAALWLLFLAWCWLRSYGLRYCRVYYGDIWFLLFLIKLMLVVARLLLNRLQWLNKSHVVVFRQWFAIIEVRVWAMVALVYLRCWWSLEIERRIVYWTARLIYSKWTLSFLSAYRFRKYVSWVIFALLCAWRPIVTTTIVVY